MLAGNCIGSLWLIAFFLNATSCSIAWCKSTHKHLGAVWWNSRIHLRLIEGHHRLSKCGKLSIYLFPLSAPLFWIAVRRGFRLPQRSHLRTLKYFVIEKSGKRCEKSEKRCEKSGKHWIKSANLEILRRFIFFLYPRLAILRKNMK